MSTTELHASIIALVSLSAGIASKHPDMGLCQLSKLRAMGISEDQINTVIDIARHIRDEAAQKIDAAFDNKSQFDESVDDSDAEPEASNMCCSSTPSPDYS